MGAFSVVFAWWAGVNIGHFGFGSGAGLPWSILLVLFLIDPGWRLVRAALVPLNRDGRQ